MYVILYNCYIDSIHNICMHKYTKRLVICFIVTLWNNYLKVCVQ